MQRIADWLKKFGTSEYAERFAENDIEIDIIPQLTDHDLERLGVSLGHRRRVLRAIRELAGSPQAAGQTAAAVSPAPHDGAERRQLTVMFCDLVGSTAVSVEFDLEDLRAIIADYHCCCTELVECNGGFVARRMGDGVLAYFGYPQAHEHNAEVRVGIATGLVVVGDLIGAGAAQGQAVVGETPNLAHRLQTLAEPGVTRDFAMRLRSRTCRAASAMLYHHVSRA